MRNYRRALSALLLGAGLVMMTHSSSAQSISLCYENETYLPWQIKDGKGLDVLLLEKAAAKAGVKIELVPLPWKRCLADVEHGVVAGAFAASFNADRANFAVYPTAVDNKPDVSRRIRYDSYTLYR